MADETPAPKVKKRGRPSNREKTLGSMVALEAPETIAPTLFPRAGAPYEIIPEVGIEEKLVAISTKIGERLEKCSIEGATRFARGDVDGVDLSRARPWGQKASPENQLRFLEAGFVANEGMVSALVAHLVEHIVIGEDLKAQANRVRALTASASGGIPSFMEDLVDRLLRAGVTARDVHHVNRERLDRIVEVLREPSHINRGNVVDRRIEEASEDGLADLVDPAPLDVSDEFPGPDDGKSVFLSETPAEVVSDAPVVIEAPVVDGPATASRPAGLWDGLDATGLPYEIVERSAESDEDMAALRFRLPETRSILELALPTGREKQMAESAGYGDYDMGKKVLVSWSQRVGTNLSEAEMEAWLFLLLAVPDPVQTSKVDRRLRFRGLVLPGPSGTSRVREVRVREG